MPTAHAVVLAGIESARWGVVPRHTSAIATLALVAERLGDDISYDWLMGASGAAFRVQIADGRLCPSSSNASCGFDCRRRGLEAWGRRFDHYPLNATAGAEAPAVDLARARARSAVVASIDRGVPATYDREESSLIVGYTESSLLLRSNAARTDGYERMESWPWSVSVAGSGAAPAIDGDRALLESCALARELFETEKNGAYRSGRAAYLHWAELLADNAAFARQSPQERFFASLGNALTLQGLGDARSAAGRYLAGAAERATGPARLALQQASEKYAELGGLVLSERKALAPYPWELGDPSQLSPTQWPSQQRMRQAEFLARACALDERGIESLDVVARAATS
jgi:hypothetical protein